MILKELAVYITQALKQSASSQHTVEQQTRDCVEGVQGDHPWKILIA